MLEKMNIILIMADQWRGDCLGLAGHSVVETPNLDRLFHDGVVFDQAYSAVPSCIAARAALLTGLSQRNHGRVGYKDRVKWDYKEIKGNPNLIKNFLLGNWNKEDYFIVEANKTVIASNTNEIFKIKED